MSIIRAFCPQYSGGTYEDHYETDGPLCATEADAQAWLDLRRDPANSYGEVEHLRVFSLVIEEPSQGFPTKIERTLVSEEVFVPPSYPDEDEGDAGHEESAQEPLSPEEQAAVEAAQATAQAAAQEAAACRDIEEFNRTWRESRENLAFARTLDADALTNTALFARVEILPAASGDTVAVGFDEAGSGTALGRMSGSPRVGVVMFPFPLDD